MERINRTGIDTGGRTRNSNNPFSNCSREDANDLVNFFKDLGSKPTQNPAEAANTQTHSEPDNSNFQPTEAGS